METRLSKVRQQIINKPFDAILVSSLPNITYLTGFSGFSKDEREAFLLITYDKQYILTDGRYSETIRNKITGFELIEISGKLSFEKALKYLTKKHKIKRLGIEEYNLTVKEHKNILKHFNNIYHYSVDSLRTIKDRGEVAAIEKACRLGDKTFEHVLTCINPGVSEKELAFEIEFFIKKQGADISFPPIVAFGKNSAFPHHKTSDQRLKTNDQILLDFGVKLNNYCSDMTRTVFFGKPTAEQKRMYQTVLDAQQKTIKFLHLGGGRLKRSGSHHSPEVDSIKAKEVDKTARKYITSHGFPAIPHSLGHGVGLEVHESPRLSPKSKDILKPGMVFSIEPGIYIPGFGGVRIEDLVVLEKSGLPRHKAGPRLLTKSPKKVIQI